MKLAKSAVFDTNLYIGVLMRQSKAAKLYRKYLTSTFDEVRSPVVLHELMRGDKFEDRFEPKAFKINKWLGRGQTEAPTTDDWQLAGKALQQIHNREVVRLRKMTNDALIAAYCLRTGSTLISADQDYNDLRGTQALRDLRFLDWTKLQATILAG